MAQIPKCLERSGSQKGLKALGRVPPLWVPGANAYLQQVELGKGTCGVPKTGAVSEYE